MTLNVWEEDTENVDNDGQNKEKLCKVKIVVNKISIAGKKKSRKTMKNKMLFCKFILFP